MRVCTTQTARAPVDSLTDDQYSQVVSIESKVAEFVLHLCHVHSLLL